MTVGLPPKDCVFVNTIPECEDGSVGRAVVSPSNGQASIPDMTALENSFQKLLTPYAASLGI